MSELLNSGSRERALHLVIERIKDIEQQLKCSKILKIKDWIDINKILSRQKEIAEIHIKFINK